MNNQFKYKNNLNSVSTKTLIGGIIPIVIVLFYIPYGWALIIVLVLFIFSFRFRYVEFKTRNTSITIKFTQSFICYRNIDVHFDRVMISSNDQILTFHNDVYVVLELNKSLAPDDDSLLSISAILNGRTFEIGTKENAELIFERIRSRYPLHNK